MRTLARTRLFRAIIAAAGALLVCAPVDIGAEQRVVRHYTEQHGLPVAEIVSLAQDARGFLWIGTSAGLVRYDGAEMSRWAGEIISEEVSQLIAGPRGTVYLRTRTGGLFTVAEDTVVPVEGPDLEPLRSVSGAALDSDGRLWVATAQGLLRRSADRQWTVVGLDRSLESHWPIRALRPRRDGGIYLLSRDAVAAISEEGAFAWRLPLDWPVDLLEQPDGTLVIASASGEIVAREQGRLRTLFKLDARAIDLARRDGRTWAAFDRFLVGLPDAGQPAIIGPADGLPSGGPLLVDHENSLWVGTFSGLLQFPEPETVWWNDRDGLPSAHARFLTRTDEGIWASFWQGLGRLNDTGEPRVAPRERVPTAGRVCVDGDGTAWIASSERFAARRDGQWREYPAGKPLEWIIDCAPARPGELWLGTHAGLFRTSRQGPVAVPLFHDSTSGEVDAVLEDGSGRLWIALRNRICSRPVAEIWPVRPADHRGGTGGWQCTDVEEVIHFTRFLELPSGSLWVASQAGGVHRYTGHRWEVVPAARELASRVVLNLNVSPRGGVWLAGVGVFVRVIERGDGDGWDVVERPSFWQGLPGHSVHDVLEDADGTLWAASSYGIVRIPPSARWSRGRPPRLELVGVLSGGTRRSSDDLASPPSSGIELRCAALSFRDRSLLRYQVRLRPEDPWTAAAGGPPVFRFAKLAPGSYVAEARVSLGGDEWSSERVRMPFRIIPPWYRRPWALLLFGALAVLLVHVVVRARIRAAVEVERLRIRVAMDLHDEVGSGLGSMGILATLASDEGVPEPERKRIARTIADTALELGNSLDDIVWSLRGRSKSLPELAYYLADRGNRIFHERSGTVFHTDFPSEWPAGALPLSVHRNLLLIALEALHNASRHGAPANVTLGIRCDADTCQLWVADDGAGRAQATSRGFGLETMMRRAREIGAEITIEGARGTTVWVRFDPRAARRHRAPGAGRMNM